jgi:hypothetical protein
MNVPNSIAWARNSDVVVARWGVSAKMTRRAALMPRGQYHSCSYRHQRPVCGRDNRSYWWHVLNYLPTFRSGARFLIGYCFIAASKSESETKIGLQAIVTIFYATGCKNMRLAYHRV